LNVLRVRVCHHFQQVGQVIICRTLAGLWWRASLFVLHHAVQEGDHVLRGLRLLSLLLLQLLGGCGLRVAEQVCQDADLVLQLRQICSAI